MATCGPTRDAQLERLLECPICMDSYRRAVSAPCGHTFCRQCIMDYVTKSEETRPESENRSTFTCPVCRQCLDVPEDGIETLPKNYIIDNLVDAIHLKVTAGVANCECCQQNGQSVVATARCQHCGKYFCDKCKTEDEKCINSLTNHDMIALTVDPDSGVTIPRTKSRGICPIHQDELLRYYCVQCDLLICRDCHVVHHYEHKCRDISEVAIEESQNIQRITEDMQIAVQNNETVLNEILKLRVVLREAQEDALGQMRCYKTRCLESMTRHFVQIEDEITTTTSASVKLVDIYADLMKQDLAILQHDIEKAAAACNDGSDAEKFYSSRELSQKSQLQTYAAASDCDRLKQSLHIPQFQEGDFDKLNQNDMFGFCKKQNMLSISGAANTILNTVTNNSLEQSMLLEEFQLFDFFNAGCLVYSTAVTPSGDIELACHAKGLITQNETKTVNRTQRNFTPGGVKKWSPLDVTLCKDESLLIVNHALAKDGGGCFIVNRERTKAGRIPLDKPLSAACVNGVDAIVLRQSEGNRFCIEVRNMKTGKVMATTASKPHVHDAIMYPQFITVHDVTGHILITHQGGVTSLSYPDLEVRWTYRGVSGKEVRDPRGVCVDSAGRILVADFGTRRVLILDGDGEYITAFRTRHLSRDPPQSLALTKDGHLVITSWSLKSTVSFVRYTRFPE